jgi:hypothetical protein
MLVQKGNHRVGSNVFEQSPTGLHRLGIDQQNRPELPHGR